MKYKKGQKVILQKTIESEYNNLKSNIITIKECTNGVYYFEEIKSGWLEKEIKELIEHIESRFEILDL